MLIFSNKLIAIVAILLLLSFINSSISETLTNKLALNGESMSWLRVLSAENLMTELCSLVKNSKSTLIAYEISLLFNDLIWE